MAGSQSFPLSSVSPLTSQTQLMEKLPVHTKSVLNTLWRHPQRKLSTPPPWLINRAFFFKGNKGKAEEIPKTAQCVGEGGSIHQSKAVSSGGHPEVRHPPPRETALQTRAGGWRVSPGWTSPGLCQMATLNLLDVSLVLQNNTHFPFLNSEDTNVI